MPKKPKSPKKRRSDHKSQRQDAGEVECPRCRKFFRKRGIKSHERSCASTSNEVQDLTFERMVSRELETERARRAHEYQPMDMQTNLDYTDMPFTPQAAFSRSVSIDVDEIESLNLEASPMQDIHDHAPHSVIDIAFDHMSDPRGNYQSVEGAQDNEIRVEYHPSSGKVPQKFGFYEYNASTASGIASSDSDLGGTIHREVDKEPWRPFASRIDFEVAELILNTHMNKNQTDSLLALIHECIANPGSFTLSNSDHLTSVWENARTKTTQFEKKTVSVPYPKKTSTNKLEFDFWSQPIWQWCDSLLSESATVSQFRWNAERIFKYNEPKAKFERCITEPWTADTWWDIQSRLPDGGLPLCILLYADKTQLSSFGTAKGYPVIARCANLPVEIRNGKGLAGGRLVGWLPIIKEDAGETKKKRYVNLKRVVWHEAFKEILESIIQYSETGVWKECGDGILRWLFPLILLLSADYEEQCFMTLIRGINSLFPCPVCLVPDELLSDLSVISEQRTTIAMSTVYGEAQALGLAKKSKEKDAKLKAYVLRDVENVFWSLQNSDVYAAISWDRLHAYHGGLFSDHLWELFKKIVDKLGKPSAKLIDMQIDKIPRWSNLNHFSSIMKTGEFTDGGKYEDMSKIIIYASHNVLKPDVTPEGYLLLKLLRSYLELDMYASLTMHTEVTITAGRAELLHFDSLLKIADSDLFLETRNISTYPESKDWDFPKAHTHLHMFDDIQKKGVTRNFNTKPNENAHRPFKKFYIFHTNFKDVDSQIIRLDEISVVSMMIREGITALDDELQNELEAESSLTLDEINLGAGISSDITHITVGSKLDLISLSDVEVNHSTDLAFKDFRKKVSTALQASLNADTDLINDTFTRVTLHADHKIVPYQYVKVHYESVIDWEMKTDILRVNPNFYNHPRYDYVLLQAHSDDYIFAQLLYVFGITYKEHTRYMALILPMDATLPLLNRPRDRDLRFTRVNARPRSSCVVVDLETVIRGALLVEDYGAPLSNEYIVIEVIDGDLWWRMKSIKLAQKVSFA